MPTTTQRGYGSSHMKERARWKLVVDAGNGFCVYHGGWLDPAKMWHLAHDHRNGGYLGPACVRCNIAERNRRHARRRRVRSRVW